MYAKIGQKLRCDDTDGFNFLLDYSITIESRRISTPAGHVKVVTRGTAMQSDHPVLTIAEARRRAKEALVDLDHGRSIIPENLGDLISAVEGLADQFERSRRELAEVQAEYVQMEYVHLSLVETWNKVMALLPRLGLHINEHYDAQGNTYTFRWDKGPIGADFLTLPDALEAALRARLGQPKSD